MCDSHLVHGRGGRRRAGGRGEGGAWVGGRGGARRGGGRRGGRGAAQLRRLVAAVGALRHAVARVVHRDALAAVPALELVAAAPPCFTYQTLP